MTVRPATTDDCAAILGVAERSFQASYSLSPDQIEALLQEEFSEEELTARIEDDTTLLVLAEDEGEVLGFADADIEGATLRWLHVDPLERGNGVGTALVERVIQEVAGHEDTFTAHILEEATEGDSFLERFGLNRSDTKAADFGEQRLSVHAYTRTAQKVEANEPAVKVPDGVMVDGSEKPLDREERIPGTEAPFFVIYTAPNRSERYGFFCSSCGSTAVAADDLDRLKCSSCGNKHRADEWDDAYL
jgi:GNAT superfamily N-acetyltransferase/ribosomal protein S27AE